MYDFFELLLHRPKYLVAQHLRVVALVVRARFLVPLVPHDGRIKVPRHVLHRAHDIDVFRHKIERLVAEPLCDLKPDGNRISAVRSRCTSVLLLKQSGNCLLQDQQYHTQAAVV